MAGVGASPSATAKDLLIFPFNGNGIEALDCLGGAHRLICFVDDTPAKQGIDSRGFRVCARSALTEWPEASVLAVPGSPATYRVRRETIDGLQIARRRFASVIHPSARISPLATIGCNVLIMAGVVITSNAMLGDHVCVLPNTVIHHDARIEAWSLIGSNVTIAGGVIVDENCYIGSGTSIMSGRRIGRATIVGIGSNVIRDMPADSRVAGNPARKLA